MRQPLPWSHRGSEVAEGGLSETRIATATERSAIAQALDVVSCDEVKAEYVMRPIGEGRYRMTGKISARLTQKCVVTLELISQTIKEDFDVEFRPAGSLPEMGDAEVEVLSFPEIEPIEHGSIEAGRFVFEMLSATLDPYPRKEGARFDWEDPASTSEPSATGPFAGLKKLKDEH